MVLAARVWIVHDDAGDQRARIVLPGSLETKEELQAVLAVELPGHGAMVAHLWEPVAEKRYGDGGNEIYAQQYMLTRTVSVPAASQS